MEFVIKRIEGLKELGFSWSKISRMLVISRMTLHRRRLELDLDEEQNYNDIEDEVLDVFLRSIIDLSPNGPFAAERSRGTKSPNW